MSQNTSSGSTPSARGLFRSMGKVAKPKTIRLLDGSYSKTDKISRAEDDYTPTPPEPTLALVHYERQRIADFPLVWEAACGDGRMMRDMAACGLKVIGSDLRDRGSGGIIRDFFSFKEPLSPCLITNPPYDQCNERDGKGRWIWHALDVLKIDYMALLLNWSWPGAGGHAGLWLAHPPARAYLMRWKIDFTGEGSPSALNAWFIWDKKHQGTTEMLMMDRVDARQSDWIGGS